MKLPKDFIHYYNLGQYQECITILKKIIKNKNDELKNLHSIINKVPINIYWKGCDGRYLGCNDQVVKFSGLTSEKDIIGKRDDELPWKAYASALKLIDDKVLVTEQDNKLEEYPIVNGEKRTYLTVKSPLYNNNILTGLIGFSIDITAEKKAKELAIDNLKKEKQLLLQSLQVEKNNKIQLSLRKNFILETINGLSHEINQPLTAVTNYASGIKRRLQSYYGDDLPADIQEALHQCKLQAKRAGDLIHSFKNLISKGDISKEPCDINKLIISDCTLLTDLLNEEHIVLEYQLDETLPIVNCDPMQITQIIYNLIMNAKEAILESKAINKTIVITTTRHSDNTVLLSIQDFATGIASSILDKIFLPFFTSKENGTGIGLSLAYTIAQRHGGHLSVESILGKGAKFNLILPV